jgi:hypothetical protein
VLAVAFRGEARAGVLDPWQRISEPEARQILHSLEVVSRTIEEDRNGHLGQAMVRVRLQCSLEALMEDHDFFAEGPAESAVKFLAERGTPPDFDAWRKARAAWWEQERVIRPWLARLDILADRSGREDPDLLLSPAPDWDPEPDVPALEARMEALAAGKGRSPDAHGEYVALARRVSEVRSRVGRNMLLLFVRARWGRLEEEAKRELDLEVLRRAMEKQDQASAETDAWMADVDWRARHP